MRRTNRKLAEVPKPVQRTHADPFEAIEGARKLAYAAAAASHCLTALAIGADSTNDEDHPLLKFDRDTVAFFWSDVLKRLAGETIESVKEYDVETEAALDAAGVVIK